MDGPIRAISGHIKSTTGLDSGKQLAASSTAKECTVSETVLGLGTAIKGEIRLAGFSTIEGQVEGEIYATGILVISPSAKIVGNIKASELVIKGSVQGEISCSEKIELVAGSSVLGRIESPRLIIHDGVRFEGQCSMPDGGISSQSSSARILDESTGLQLGSLASVARTAN